MMENTRTARRDWILNSNPDATTVLKRFPRFQDMNDAVCTICDMPSVITKYSLVQQTVKHFDTVSNKNTQNGDVTSEEMHM